MPRTSVRGRAALPPCEPHLGMQGACPLPGVWGYPPDSLTPLGGWVGKNNIPFCATEPPCHPALRATPLPAVPSLHSPSTEGPRTLPAHRSTSGPEDVWTRPPFEHSRRGRVPASPRPCLCSAEPRRRPPRVKQHPPRALRHIETVNRRPGGAGGSPPAGGLGVSPRFFNSSGRVGGQECPTAAYANSPFALSPPRHTLLT